jgi:hypothetical protein
MSSSLNDFDMLMDLNAKSLSERDNTKATSVQPVPLQEQGTTITVEPSLYPSGHRNIIPLPLCQGYFEIFNNVIRKYTHRTESCPFTVTAGSI